MHGGTLGTIIGSVLLISLTYVLLAKHANVTQLGKGATGSARNLIGTFEGR